MSSRTTLPQLFVKRILSVTTLFSLKTRARKMLPKTTASGTACVRSYK
jgi:hypothetical protein